MREPWDILMQFSGALQQQAAQSRATADNALLRMFGTNIARQDAATAQGYNVENASLRNMYATDADTVAFERQLQRDQAARDASNEQMRVRRGYDLEDAAAGQANRQANIILEQSLLAEREALERGGVPKPRRFGSLSPDAAAIVQSESGGKFGARSSTSSAWGPGQYIDSTAEAVRKQHPELNLQPGWQNDPAQFEIGHEAHTSDNAKVLVANGIEPTRGNKKAAHFLGAGGAVRVLRQPDNTSLAAVVGNDVMAANPHLKGMTVGQFKQWANASVGGSTTIEGGVRRYTDTNLPVGAEGEVSNEAGSNVDNGSIPPVSPWMQQYLDEQGLEAKERVTMTEAQMDLLPPELREQFMPDVTDTSQQGVRGAKTEYIRVQPRVMPDATGLPTPKKPTNSAAPVQVQKAAPGRWVDGKFVIDDQEIELPD